MVNPNQIASRNANSSRLVNSDSYTISNVNEHKTKELPLRPTIVWSSEQSKYSENITESSAFSYQNENTKTLLLENKTKELDINHMVNGTADEGTKTLLLNNPSTQLKNSKSTTNRSEVSRGVNDSLFRRIFMHLFENNQFSIKYDQEVFVKSNKRVARGFEILRTQSEIDRTIQFNSNNISRKVYGFLAECFLCLIPKDIRDERGSYYCYLNCIANHFKIENYKFNKEKLRNICRMRERNLKKTNTRLESPEEIEIK
uniref:Uncharacterized protein n=1 Tax=Strongyloides venezuelensis TaxID=75913 RepID=A0A0K0FX33_STRVS